jgi:Peptidase C13 family
MMPRLISLLCLSLVACATTEAPPPAAPLSQPTAWKAVLIAGDNSEAAFDNAVDAMAEKLVGFGVQPADIAVLKASASDGQAADRGHIFDAFDRLAPAGNEGCFVFITSHGDGQRGLVMRAAKDFLGPDELDRLLDRRCGQRPTVVIASGCFSGIFARGDSMPAANRTILTAARRDRASFGCNAQRELTIFDECMLDNLDQGRLWQVVMEATRDCVVRYEDEANVRPPSAPQLFIGPSVEGHVAFPT